MTIYGCIKCKSEFKNTRESLMDGMRCPACRGHLIPKHEFFEVEKVNPSLLTIELEDESSVPKMKYRGEEIKGIIKTSFDWETRTANECGGAVIHIEHATIKERLDVRTIGHKIGKCAFDS